MSNQPSHAGNRCRSAQARVQIGTNRIVEDAAITKLSNEQVRNLLKAQYPEIANATIRESADGETRLIEFFPLSVIC